MPTGILGSANPLAITNTTLYTVPTGKIATVNVNLCNRGTAPITVQVALSAAAIPTLNEYIEFNATIPANSVLERTAIVLAATQKVVVQASVATLSALVTGFEE